MYLFKDLIRHRIYLLSENETIDPHRSRTMILLVRLLWTRWL